MNNFDNLTVVIPVREDSSRIKDKIYLPIRDNYSLLEWKISQLLEVIAPNKIVVSSKSEKVKDITRNMNVEYHERSQYLTEGHIATFSEVIKGVVKEIETDHFAWVTVVVPLMSPSEYLDGFQKYFEYVVDKKEFDSLVSVNLLKEYLWNETEPINYEATKNHTISQNLPNIYKITNGLYMASKELVNEKEYFLGPNPFKHIVSEIAGIDIDVNEDYEIAKALIPIYDQKNKSNFLGF